MIMKNYEESVELKWPYILNHPYKVLIIGGSGSDQSNASLAKTSTTRY